MSGKRMNAMHEHVCSSETLNAVDPAPIPKMTVDLLIWHLQKENPDSRVFLNEDGLDVHDGWEVITKIPIEGL
jgi:hypothetical protein